MPSSSAPVFDPYHKWLGIPPSEQPANHYTLLGIAIYESDAEVIAAASDRQMAHVKAFATGPYAAQSQSLLNELARARVTLLNARQKVAYDERLRQSSVRAQQAALVASLVEERGSAVAGKEGLRPETKSPRLQYGRPRNAEALPTSPIFRPRQEGLPTYFLLIVTAVFGATFYFAYGIWSQWGDSAAATSASTKTHAPRRPPAGVRRERPELRRRPRNVATADARVARETPAPASASASRSPAVAGDDDSDLEPALQDQPINGPPAGDGPTEAPKTQTFDLDLTNRRQRLDLTDLSGSHFRVLSLTGCETPYDIQPDDGRLDETNRVTIAIHSIREVVIELVLRKTSSGSASILAAYYAINDANNKVPFTLAKLNAICRDISKKGTQAVAAQNALQAEKTQLTLWVSSPGIKPLEDVGPAKARIMELDVVIANQQAVVQRIQADLEVAEALEKLAVLLHEDCAIEVAPAEESRLSP